MRELDCRGLACPEPVIRTKEALDGMEEGEELCVLVDGESAVENVSRLAETLGHEVKVISENGYFVVFIRKNAEGEAFEYFCCACSEE